MTATIEPTRFDEHDALTLRNDAVEAVVLPAVGGKVVSLKSRHSGRQWLWRNPQLPLRRPEYGASYVETMDSGGLDEIFPSVSPCEAGDQPWATLARLDHGELVALPWQVRSSGVDESGAAVVRLGAAGRAWAYRFERTITLSAEEATIRFAYALTNDTERPLPFLWAMHPLLHVEPGMRIELRQGTPMRIAARIGGPSASSGGSAAAAFDWPIAPGGEDVSLTPDPAFEPGAMKLFTAAGAVDRAAVLSPAGDERFELAFHTSQVPHLGLWLNWRGWSGAGGQPYFNLGIEPTTAPCDRLDEALAQGAARVLGPHATTRWHVMLGLNFPLT